MNRKSRPSGTQAITSFFSANSRDVPVQPQCTIAVVESVAVSVLPSSSLLEICRQTTRGTDVTPHVVDSAPCGVVTVERKNSPVTPCGPESNGEEPSFSTVPESPRARKKRPRTASKEEPKTEAPARQLHSFFTNGPAARRANARARLAAAEAVTTSAVRAAAVSRSNKRRRTGEVPCVDPWNFPEAATRHVGESCVLPVELDSLAFGDSVGSRGIFLDGMDWTPEWSSAHQTSLPASIRCVPRTPKDTSTKLWSDLSRVEGFKELDALNQKHISDLTNWLSPFYSKRSRRSGRCVGTDDSDSELESDDGDGAYHFRKDGSEDALSEDECYENVALLTGPVGCGKSTVIKLAAARLGLEILEVNALTVRTGRRVKEIVGDALANNRVHAGPKQASLGNFEAQNSGFNTLIVFEEVDQISEDERGFWSCILELSSSAQRRRPILMTANHVTPEMLEIFGDLRCDADGEITKLVCATEPDLPEGSLAVFKHLKLESPAPPLCCAAVTAVSRSVDARVSKLTSRTLTGDFGSDCRAMTNAAQFWSLNGVGHPHDYQVLMSNRPGDGEEFGLPPTMSMILASQPKGLSKETPSLDQWADAYDVVSDADVHCSLYSAAVVEESALHSILPRLSETSCSSGKRDGEKSFLLSLASTTSRLRVDAQKVLAYPRPSASASRPFHVHIRSYVRQMVKSESHPGRVRGSGRRSTRSMAAQRPATVSRLSEEALKTLAQDRFKM